MVRVPVSSGRTEFLRPIPNNFGSFGKLLNLSPLTFSVYFQPSCQKLQCPKELY